MVHKTISAANELRAPPRGQGLRLKLVYHSRKAGIEQSANSHASRSSRGREGSLANALPMPPKTNKRVCEPSGDNVRWVDGWPYRVYPDGYVQIGTGAKGSMFPRFSVRLTSCTACPCIELTDLTPRPRSISPILESVILPGSLLSPY